MESLPMAGPEKVVRLEQGTIRYHEYGTGSPIVFVHGVLANGTLWRAVVPTLAAHYRCIVPDWPLGAHSVAMHPGADLTPPSLARLIVDFLTALDLDAVTLVANDNGGALCQIVAADHPERLARLVLTNCDAFKNFPPRMLQPLVWGAHLPGFVTLSSRMMRMHSVRRLFLQLVCKHPVSPAAETAYFGPVIANGAVRRDLGKVMRGIAPRYTLAAADKLHRFTRPVLLVWAPEDRIFPIRDAERLRDLFPNASLHEVPDSYAFIPEDQPARLAALIAGFLHETAAA